MISCRAAILLPAPRFTTFTSSSSYSTSYTGVSSDDTTLSTQRATTTNCRVAFVGLGNMGQPMALNLIRTLRDKDTLSSPSSTNNLNVTVLAFDTNQEAGATLLRHTRMNPKLYQRGTIEVIKSLADLGSADCDVVISMLPGCAALNTVMSTIRDSMLYTNHNIPASSSKRLTFIDCSTVSPTTSRHWHDIWAQQGHAMLDAPVSGGVLGAATGSLTFMVGGGGHSTFNQHPLVLPLLQRMGQRIIDCGGPGTGAATKLCNNLALSSQMIGIAEALNLGEALGVDPVVLTEVINTSTAACWSSKMNNPHPIVAAAMVCDGKEDEGTPAAHSYRGGFASSLMLKDLGLAVSVADEVNVALPMTATSKELYQLAVLRGLGSKDFGVILEFLKGM